MGSINLNCPIVLKQQRPLRFTVNSETEKAVVMNNLKYLKEAPDAVKNLIVSHDLTPTQRQQRKDMLEKANVDIEEGYIAAVRSVPGPRWDPKVVKLRRRNKKQEAQLPPVEGQATSAVEQPTPTEAD